MGKIIGEHKKYIIERLFSAKDTAVFVDRQDVYISENIPGTNKRQRDDDELVGSST